MAARFSFPRLARVRTARIQLLPDQAQLVGAGRRRRPEGLADLRLPAAGGPDFVERDAGMQRIDTHLTGLVEVPDREVCHHHRRPASDPALLASDPLRNGGAAEVAGRGPEVDLLD